MIGPLKFALSTLLVTLVVMTQAFCACAVTIQNAHDMPALNEMSHHDHGTMSDLSDEKTPPCEHCEEGINRATNSTSSMAINALLSKIQYLNRVQSKPIIPAPFKLADKALERPSRIDPPPMKAHTPISLKIRLLT